VVGDYDDTEVYRSLRADEARMVVALDSDVRNTNVAFSLREFVRDVPLVARAERDESIDILKLAGSTWVFQFRKALGQSLTRRVVTGRLSVSQLATFGPLVIAETSVKQTDLGGMTIREADLRGRLGINIVGLWNHGAFEHPMPDTVFEDQMVIVLAGTRQQIEAFTETVARELPADEAPGPVMVLGGGRVGAAAALALKDRGLNVVVVDKVNVAPYMPGVRVQVGDAADPVTLEKAGIKTAPSIIITTHDDDINTYLTIYCRHLRPDVQIISRTNLDRNVHVLHAAGANLVLSLASLVSNRIINLLEPGRVFMLNEGLNIFRAQAGAILAGKSLMTSGIRRNARCNVVAVKTAEGEMLVNPDPRREFRPADELFLIGDSTSETAYYEKYWPDRGLASEDEDVEDVVQAALRSAK
jgi:Trk K+ transport system NAD-binding subunit